jgi:hypothetical protein
MGRKRIYSDSDTHRICRVCKQTLDVSKFAPNRIKGNGYLSIESRCYDCQSARRRKGAPRPKNRTPRHEVIGSTDPVVINRLSKYGLTVEAFDQLFLNQNGLCGVCDRSLGEKFCIDHDHNTNAVRGLLCYRCNSGIGQLGDSIEGLNRAITYLSR